MRPLLDPAPVQYGDECGAGTPKPDKSGTAYRKAVAAALRSHMPLDRNSLAVAVEESDANGT